MRKTRPNSVLSAASRLCRWVIAGLIVYHFFLSRLAMAEGAAQPTSALPDLGCPRPLLYWPRFSTIPSSSAFNTSDLLARADRLTLTDVIDLALENNPVTRAAWADAKATAAKYSSERGDYLPAVSLSASVNSMQQSAAPNRPIDPSTTYSGSANLSYLIFDFGGRKGTIKNAYQSMLAANWQFAAAVQDIALQVETAYFRYMSMKSLRSAEEMNVKEAEMLLQSARERHSVGLATISDVLQAQTVLSRSLLNRQKVDGDLMTTRGALALSMGIPANAPYDIEDIPGEISIEQITDSIDYLIEEALARRPDFLAEKSRVEAARAHIQEIAAERLPSFRVTANFTRTYYRDEDLWADDGKSYSDSYSGGFSINFPLFSGFSDIYKIHQAKHQAEFSQEKCKALEQQIIYQVFSSYYNLKTATQQVKTSEDFLAAAEASEEVAQGRYKEGVGSIIDLIIVQRSLSEARAQSIQSRWSWFIAFTQLCHASGVLLPDKNQAVFHPLEIESSGGLSIHENVAAED